MILAPGIHPSIPSDTYHSDALTDQPSLSASIAAVLTSKTPAHARLAHPRLNPNLVRKEKKEFDVGHVAHALLLEKRDPFDVVKIIEGYDNWQKKQAQTDRDYWREQGFIPLLSKDFDAVMAMVDAAVEQIASSEVDPLPLSDGAAEVTVTCTINGVACKSRVDWLRDDHTVIDDYKTSQSADQLWFSRRGIYGDNNYDVKAAFYLRVLAAARAEAGLSHIDTQFRWVVQEKDPPYLLSVVTPGPDVLALGDDKVDKAINLWRECLATDTWPGYDRRVATAELPPFEEIKWMERRAA